jgi:hypothetical protein
MLLPAKLGSRSCNIRRRVTMVMDSLGGGFRILRKRSNLCTRARHKVVEAVPVPEVGREVGASRRLAVTPSHPVNGAA